MTMTPKHPHITVPLTGEDGNAFAGNGGAKLGHGSGGIVSLRAE